MKNGTIIRASSDRKGYWRINKLSAKQKLADFLFEEKSIKI